MIHEANNDTEYKERNKKLITMKDITNIDTVYTNHSNSEIQMPHYVALNIEGVGDNLVGNLDREDEQVAQMRKNAKSEALKYPLEEFFEQYKDPNDTNAETNKGDNEAYDEESDDSKDNMEERNNIDGDLGARYLQ